MRYMNRLQNETSPYLLQHVDNPVDWFPWGEEALEKARAEDKPILLSVGYSACHWCHVMAHESFEDNDTAAMMNELFVNVKVDREERPDVDDIYMKATQLFSRGGGGWPMTVFMTPDGHPFHAGTYYPPTPRYGMPSFKQVMLAVTDAYENRRDEVVASARQVASVLQSDMAVNIPEAEEFTVDEALLNGAVQQLIARADPIHGGLHPGHPKFPSPMNLEFLLRSGDPGALEVVKFTLKKMAEGGIYDQIGFGFHRYSVDERWLVPHFEKMLYDNAQLARVYLHAFQMTGEPFFERICRQILTYVEREMLDAGGGFYSTQDADSEGEEGKFFVWTEEEFRDALAPKLEETVIEALAEYWGVTAAGNFEGKNILNVAADIDAVAGRHNLTLDAMTRHLENARQHLFELREKRIKPGRDEKMLAAWNGMMLAAFAEAARVLDSERYAEIAVQNAQFLLGELSTDDGRLFRTNKEGRSKLNGYLEDYANVIDGLLELYQTDFQPRWYSEAARLADHVLVHFADPAGGGFFDTSDDHEQLIARPRSLQDNATPGANNLTAFNFIRLAAYSGDARYEDAAWAILRQIVPAVQQYPSAFGTALSAIHLLVKRPVEVAIIGTHAEGGALFNIVQGPFRPTVITASAPQDQDKEAVPALLAGRSRRDGRATVYVCQNFACAAPVTTAEALAELL